MSGSQGCPAVEPCVVREPRALILPYDGSAAARAALRYARDRLRRRHGEGLILLLPRRPRCAMLRRRDRLRLHADLGPDTRVRTLGDDLPAALGRLVADLPAPTFLVTLEQRGTALVSRRRGRPADRPVRSLSRPPSAAPRCGGTGRAARHLVGAGFSRTVRRRPR